MNITTNEISPQLLRCAYYNGFSEPHDTKMTKRYVYDYEIEFFAESQGGIIVNGEYHRMHKGDVHLRRPGQFVQGVLPYNCYFICLDIAGRMNKLSENYSIDVQQEFSPKYSNPILDALPIQLKTQIPELYESLFSTILYEFIHKSNASELKIKALLLQLLYQMYNDSTKNHLFNIKETPYHGILQKALSYIETNLFKTLRIPEIAAHIGLSPNYFQKIFAENLGVTPNNYIIAKRIEKAKELLATSSSPIAHIAEYIGYERVSYFNYTFKQLTGETPHSYRNKYKY